MRFKTLGGIILFSFVLVIGLFFSMSFAQQPDPGISKISKLFNVSSYLLAQAPEQMGGPPGIPPVPPPPPGPMGVELPPGIPPPPPGAMVVNPPPNIFIQGKERESFQKVFVEKIKVDQQIDLKFFMFDREPSETLSSKTYSLPSSAKYDFKLDEKMKSKGGATFSWKPSKADVGFHTIIVEVSNSKGDASRLSLSYDVGE